MPASIKSAGKLTVATDATYAPDEFVQGTKIVGMDPDLMNALGKVMGLKVTITNVTFDDIISGMVAGRYMIGASSFTDEKSREKSVNFVDYANVGESFYTLKSGGTNIKGISSICGLTVSVETGTTEETRRQGAEQEVHQGRQEGRELRPSRHRARPTWRSPRAARSSASPTRLSPATRSSSPTASSSSSVPPMRRLPTGIAIAKSTGLTKAVKAAMLYLVKQRHLRQDLQEVGPPGHRDPRFEDEDQRRHLLESAEVRSASSAGSARVGDGVWISRS